MNIIEFAKKHGAVRYSDQGFTLKSGQTSNIYINWRPLMGDVHCLDQITDYIINVILDSGLKPQAIVGVPHGATKIGLITQFKWALRPDTPPNTIHMYRPNKTHGDTTFQETITGDTILIEDVVTSGGSILQFMQLLPGANIVGIISLTDRGSPHRFREILAEKGIWYKPLSTLEDFHVD